MIGRAIALNKLKNQTQQMKIYGYQFVGLLCVILFVILIAIGALWYKINFNFWLRYKCLPSVRGRIFSGNVWDFLTLKNHFSFQLKTIYDDPQYEKEAVVGVYGLYKPALLVRDPDLLKSIFVKDFENFTNRFAQPARRKDRIASQMLFFANDSYWKDMRSRLTQFFSSAKLKQMYPFIQEIGKNLDLHLKGKGKRFIAEVKDICMLFSIDVNSTILFGVLINSLENPKEPFSLEIKRMVEFSWIRALHHMFIFFAPYLCDILGIRFFYKSTEQIIRDTLYQAMEHRQKTQRHNNDLIDIFLKLKQEAHMKGKNMQEFMEDVYAQAAQFMIGGIATSSSAMAHGLMELARMPEVQEKLRAEILQAFIEGNGDISYDMISKLEYLDMVVHEVMRLYPLFIHLERKYEKPFERKDHYSLKPYYDMTIPEGTPIYISVYALHYDAKYWPDPKKFDPERFAPSCREKIHPMVYLPFGVGPRNCIGARLGMIHMKIGLMHFLKNHYVQVCHETQQNPVFNPKAFVIEIEGGIVLEVVGDSMCDKALGMLN
ncbi:cytochrome P450 6g1-like [Haematobia irritans]|uniref:cytochrome P450 6g1-like n=1 Tax=Haematobia irritans TaxID=7368 RepID=UPI003F4F80E9